MVVIDLLTIIPFYVQIARATTYCDHFGLAIVASLRVLRLVRIVADADVFFWLKYGDQLSYPELMPVFFHTLRNSAAAGLMLVIMYLCLCTFFSTLMYVAESHRAEFRDIPHILWWSIVTLTTTGYGDMYPLTPAGKIIASVAMVSAIFLTAFPIAVLQSAYSEAVQRVRRRGIGEVSGEYSCEYQQRPCDCAAKVQRLDAKLDRILSLLEGARSLAA